MPRKAQAQIQTAIGRHRFMEDHSVRNPSIIHSTPEIGMAETQWNREFESFPG
jgi:hypothetical protein